MPDVEVVSSASGSGAPVTSGSALEQLMRRRSCRAFLSEPLPRKLIEQTVRVAGRAPSWCNTQPWQLVVTESGETERFRSALSQHAAAHSPAPDLPFPSR